MRRKSAKNRWPAAEDRDAKIESVASDGASTHRNRNRLTELRNGLLRLHKALLDSERAVYERDIARITSTNQLLALVLHDPWFAWLHELSELVVLIDEILETSEDFVEVDGLVAQSRDLIIPAEQGTGFARHYFDAMQRDPDVVLAHAATLKLLKSLG